MEKYHLRERVIVMFKCVMECYSCRCSNKTCSWNAACDELKSHSLSCIDALTSDDFNISNSSRPFIVQ